MQSALQKRGDPLAVWGRRGATPVLRPERGSAGGAARTHPGCTRGPPTPGQRGLRGALGQPGDPSRGRSQESRERGDWKDKPLGGAGAGEEAGRALWGPRGAGRVVTLPGRSGGVQTKGARHRGAGVITGPKAGQRLQVPSPRDPSAPALVLSSGHVQRAVTQDPSRVEHAAATVLRVSVISDQGALTVTLHRPLAAAHSHSEAPCTEALRLRCCGQAGQTPLRCAPTAHPTGGRPGCGGKTPARGPDAPSPPTCSPPPPLGSSGGPAPGRMVPQAGKPPVLDWVYPVTKATQGSTIHPGQMVQEDEVKRGKDSPKERPPASARGPFAGVCPAPSSSLSSKDTPSAVPTLRAGAPGSQAPASAERGLGPGPPAPPPGRSRRGAKLTAALARVPHWLGRPAPARRQGYGQLPGRDRYCAGDPARRRPRGSLGLCADPRVPAGSGSRRRGRPCLAPLGHSPRPRPRSQLVAETRLCTRGPNSRGSGSGAGSGQRAACPAALRPRPGGGAVPA
uniref:Uncharacterized protein n=1 Tax=Rangifer tarandus platyrhynchus TaxID=3082113 RepID=A0ACB0EXI9_RANTA|nr:unnamed protein product [Rangifer tarandus platyrhynchus]